MNIENDTAIEDEDKDLDTADRGDNLADDEDSDHGADRPRDDKGRFAKSAEDDATDEDKDGIEDEEGEDTDASDGDDKDDSDDAGKDTKNFGIRLDKALRQRDEARQKAAELEARVAKLEASVTPADKGEDPLVKLNAELDELYEKVEEARADGETKTAAQLQRRIDKINKQLVTAEAEKLARNESLTTAINARFDALLDVAEGLIPEISPGSEDYDDAAVNELAGLVRAYELSGMTADKALLKAVKVLHRVDLTATEKSKDIGKAAKAAKPAKKVDVAKALDTQRRQPPDASARGVNKDDSAIRIEALSDEDFDKLPESKKAQLRGDFIA